MIHKEIFDELHDQDSNDIERQGAIIEATGLSENLLLNASAL
jgi:hypothetical protein